MFERPPELVTFFLRNLTVVNGSGNAHIEQLELAGPDYHITVLPFLVRLDHRAKQRIDKADCTFCSP